MNPGDLIAERLATSGVLAGEILRGHGRAPLDDRFVSQIRSEVGRRFALGVDRMDVRIEPVDTPQAEADRLALDLHAFRATWRPSPTRGVLVEDREGVVTLQPRWPHAFRDLDRITVPLTSHEPIAEHTYDDGEIYRIVREWADVTFAYQGIHRGSGLLVYRMLS